VTRQEQQDESIGGLARRWLKSQLKFHGDPIKSRRDQDEAEAIEQRIHEKTHDDAANAVVTALMPDSWKRKIASLERANEEGRVLREQQRRAEHEARPRVPVTLTLRGDVSGTIETEIPIRIDMPSEPGDVMTIDLEPLEPLPVGGHTFLGLLFAVPKFSGAGVYDLTAIEERLRLDSWDPLWFQLTIDTTEDGLYWSPDYGHGTVTVTDTTIRLQMPMSNGNGIDISVDVMVAVPVTLNI
jgi:hypothetical protein